MVKQERLQLQINQMQSTVSQCIPDAWLNSIQTEYSRRLYPQSY